MQLRVARPVSAHLVSLMAFPPPGRPPVQPSDDAGYLLTYISAGRFIDIVTAALKRRQVKVAVRHVRTAL
jgi:hypothetical protein